MIHVNSKSKPSADQAGVETGRAYRGLIRRRLTILSVAAVILIVAVMAIGCSPLEAPARSGGDPGSTLVALSGDGDKVSEDFYARSGWSIEWENTGQYFSYTIHGDVEFGQVITQNGPGSGITSPVPVGTFSIEVVAQGPWSIKVIQGD